MKKYLLFFVLCFLVTGSAYAEDQTASAAGSADSAAAAKTDKAAAAVEAAAPESPAPEAPAPAESAPVAMPAAPAAAPAAPVAAAEPAPAAMTAPAPAPTEEVAAPAAASAVPAAPSAAAPTAETAAAAKPATAENLEFVSGEISALDEAAKTITVKLYGETENKTSDKVLTVKVDSTTDITDGEQDRALKSLTAGTEVDVEYDPATTKATYIFVY